MTRIATHSDKEFTKSGLLRRINYRIQDNEVYQYFSQNIIQSYTREEAFAHIILASLSLISIVFYCLNRVFFHFWAIPIPWLMFLGFFFLLIIWFVIGHSHRQKWPRFGLISTTSANLGFFFLLSGIGFSSVITTPFPLIDHHLVLADKLLGFDVTAFMAWSYQYPLFIKILKKCYFSLVLQMMLTPIVLAALNRPKEINQYAALAAICFIFWLLLYYFFPTLAPAGVMHSPHFTIMSYDIVTRFNEVHQNTPISVWSGGGMVSFPSGHAMFALLALIAWRKIKIVFYPLLIINILLIIATMALGFHYLWDVIASFVIVGGAALVVHKLFSRWEHQRLTNL